MSEEQGNMEDGFDHDDFDAGFGIEDDGDNGQQDGPEENKEQDNDQQQEVRQAEAETLPYVEQQTPQYAPQQQVYQQPVQQQAAPAPQQVEIPDELRDEYEKLKQSNPRAAALAQEDTPEGQSVRDRLAGYGADIAGDRAEQVLDQRQRAIDAEAAENEKKAAFQKWYFGQLSQYQPEYTKMLLDPSKNRERAEYARDFNAWIGSKTYDEGRQLAWIANYSQDPRQVADLIGRFESERKRGARAKRPDPTGALAVPGRGAVAPSGFGDKDSFDDGWNINESEERR